jgi:hypothetical protein
VGLLRSHFNGVPWRADHWLEAFLLGQYVQVGQTDSQHVHWGEGIGFPQIEARQVVAAMAADIHPLAYGVLNLKVQVLIAVVTFAGSAEMARDAPIVSAHGAVQIALASAAYQKFI